MVDNLVNLWEKPAEEEVYMIAGWNQWADAGSISSGLPRYLVKKTGAEKIGTLSPEGFYIFQVPGTHHIFRPRVKLEAGYRTFLHTNTNEFYYTTSAGKGLVIFAGEEPQINIERYAAAFLDAVEALGVRRVGIVGGIYGALPYDKDREVSCVYSLPAMRQDLTRYAVRFSDYEGGATLGTYLAASAEARQLEVFVFYALVPAYDFSHIAPRSPQISIEMDFRAWYELMRRLNYMFGTEVDLTHLEVQSLELTQAMEQELLDIDLNVPDFDLEDYLEALGEGFQERPFIPLGEVWERGLRDLFGDLEDGDA